VTLLFVTFSYVSYLTYGPLVSSNILTDLPWDASGNAARLGMVFSVLAVYPILMASMVAPIKHSEQAAMNEQDCRLPSSSSWSIRPSTLCTWLVVALSAVAACATRDLGKVNIMNGAMQVAGLVALAPGLTGIFLLEWRGIAWRAAMFTLIGVGLVMSVAGLVYTNNYADELAENCAWSVPSGS